MTLVAILLAAASLTAASITAAAQAAQRTSRDKVYSKTQAARGADLFAKRCAACHDPAKVQPGKKAGPPLIGEKFIAEWEGKLVGGLLETTFMTMPNDGSLPLSEDETADAIAYVLQANGYPDGPADLTFDAGKDIVIVK